MQSQGKLYVVGIGPGCRELLTLKAEEVLKGADYVIGHKRYLDFIRDVVVGKIVESGMGKEVERVKKAIGLVEDGYVVCLVSGGDPSIYGLAPLVAEVIYRNGIEIDWEVVPGVSALNAASPLFGSAIAGDHAVISLSDLLTPWDIIERRLRKALEGDFVIALYNPSSRRRKSRLENAVEIIREYRGNCFVALARNVCRDGEEVMIVRLDEVAELADMHTLIIIPSSGTIVDGDQMITPRGYSEKYNLEV
ncbi:precorrin-3B C(17)-methyltransferase [Geoglobus acetivorans]|uniref:Precorrin-3B C(17)-methyltransferase n=1 Tax=Geoglobus acetivorans TaxID=565033 RepID=A0ABZ3H3J9_GEOAI|nr:precorrin-3B C(17)-methyltransferase [Geoglobus acetivorans]